MEMGSHSGLSTELTTTLATTRTIAGGQRDQNSRRISVHLAMIRFLAIQQAGATLTIRQSAGRHFASSRKNFMTDSSRRVTRNRVTPFVATLCSRDGRYADQQSGEGQQSRHDFSRSLLTCFLLQSKLIYFIVAA
jgi:hypothetical protein